MTNAIVPPSRRVDDSSNPLANWENDDLLLTEKARQIVAEAFPRAFRILSWAGFREVFQRYDDSANRAKTKFNRHGLKGALVSALGVSVLALAPLVPTRIYQSVVVAFGCGLVLAGGLLGLWHLLAHSGRREWLINRMWTERLRQFYFQYVINNLNLAIGAMGDDGKLETYCSLRDGALKAFIADVELNLSARSFDGAIRWLADDHDDARAWAESVWQADRVSPSTVMTADHRELLECLSQGRIGIQEIYAQLNLKPRNLSPANMARHTTVLGNIATFVFIVSLTLAGVLTLFDGRQGSHSSDILISLSGMSAAWGLYFRLVDQGMGYSLDAERYELYFEQMGLVRQRFNAAVDHVHDKIVALRQLEIYAYREMRQFLRIHHRSRFLG